MTRRIIGILLSLALLLALAAPGLAAGKITYGPWVSAGMADPLMVKREVFEDGKSAAWQEGKKNAGDPSIVDPYAFLIERKDGDGNLVSSALFSTEGRLVFERFITADGWEGTEFGAGGTVLSSIKVTVSGNTTTHEVWNASGLYTKDIIVDTGSGNYVAYEETIRPDGRRTFVRSRKADGSMQQGTVSESMHSPGGFRTMTNSFASNAEGNKHTSGLDVYYDKDGNFEKGRRYDPATDTWVDLKGPPDYDPWWEVWMGKPYATLFATWFPNNTASTMGLSLRDRKPGFTGKWYHVTPLDLSRQGEQVIPLLASNMYIVGEVRVMVEGDSVTVSYSMLGDNFDTARVHSEFLKLYPNLDAITSLEDEALTDGHAFNQPISIEKDLGGDTKVVMLVRNVLTYNLNYRGMRMLTRYWPNKPEHREYRTQLEALLD